VSLPCCLSSAGRTHTQHHGRWAGRPLAAWANTLSWWTAARWEIGKNIKPQPAMGQEEPGAADFGRAAPGRLAVPAYRTISFGRCCIWAYRCSCPCSFFRAWRIFSFRGRWARPRDFRAAGFLHVRSTIVRAQLCRRMAMYLWRRRKTSNQAENLHGGGTNERMDSSAG